MVAVGGVGGVSGAGVMVGVGGVSGAGGGVGGRRDENVKVSQGMIAFLLEALQTTMFTKKKDAIDTYHTYLMAQHPRYSRADALLLLYGSPLTPQSTLSTFASTSSFTKIDRGLLAAAGQLSWKNHQLRASAAKALGLVALLLDGRYNADAAVFQALLAEADYTVIKLMKLPKHLSQPSPASSAVGNLHAALRVLDILKDIRPDLIDTLLQEKDVAHGRAAPLTHPHTAPPSALSIVAGGSGASSSSSSPPPPLAVHLLHVSGSGAERERDSGASTPKATADASPRSPHSPPPLPPSHAALHFPLTPTSSTFHTAPHPLNLAAVDAAASSSDASQPPHYSHQPNVALPFSAASSPMGRSRKHFGTMQGGLQSSVVPQQQKGQWSSPATSAPQSVGVDDWKQRLRGHLSGFFASRMSREELELKGVLKAPRVFGLSLEALALHDEVDEESNVPRILRCCMLRLSAAEQLALPGLFRISGDSREIAELKVKWDVGEAVDLCAYSPHSVSGLLKMWLRELPEPLLTYELYQPLIDLFRQMQLHPSAPASASASAASPQQALQQSAHQPLLDLLERLPSLHRRTLQALLRFLAQVSAACSVNLMTTNNLAICFSPNILRPRVETLQSVARDTPIAIAVIRALIEHTQLALNAQQPTAAPHPSAHSATAHAGQQPQPLSLHASRASPSLTRALSGMLPLPLPLPLPAPVCAVHAMCGVELACEVGERCRVSPPASPLPPPLPPLSLVPPLSPRGDRTPSIPSPSRAPPPLPWSAQPQPHPQPPLSSSSSTPSHAPRSPARSLSACAFPPPLPTHFISPASPTHPSSSFCSSFSPASPPSEPPPSSGGLHKAREESKEREEEEAAAAPPSLHATFLPSPSSSHSA